MKKETLRNDFDKFLAEKDFKLTDKEVIEKAREIEKKLYESHA